MIKNHDVRGRGSVNNNVTKKFFMDTQLNMQPGIDDQSLVISWGLV